MTKKFSFNVKSSVRIWIDLDNSPHVLFFKPIIERLNKEGYNLLITARKHSQTIDLADYHDLDYIPVGRHFGKNKFMKIIGTFYRAFQLFPFVIKRKPVIALSHGSRSQIILSSLMRIPSAVFLDYEYVQSIPFAKPDVLFIPDVVNPNGLSSHYATIKTYHGIKEDLYVPNFKSNEAILDELGIDKNKVIVVVRPPASEAHYHNPKTDVLFNEAIKFLLKDKNTVTVIIPRDHKQKIQIANKWLQEIADRKIIIPLVVIDALNLMWYSDIVISGGGTMNREAAALGLPVYSIFQGKTGAVDKYLSKTGRLKFINEPSEIKEEIKLKKKSNENVTSMSNNLLLDSIIDEIKSLIINLDYKSGKKYAKSSHKKK